MLHFMRLYHDPFTKIKAGTKTIEIRLYDEKRQLVNIDDEIQFTDVTNGEVILCKVKNIYKYPDFEALYKNPPKLSLGYADDENADPEDMSKYYSKENIAKYGAVGIEISIN